MGKINKEQLETLEQLLDDGVITEEEYSKKVSQMAQPEPEPKIENQMKVEEIKQPIKESSKKSPIVAIIIGAVCLFIGLAIGATAFGDNESSSSSSTFGETETEKMHRYCYYTVKDFYLDYAVLVFDGDVCYHRYGCPLTPTGGYGDDEYTFGLFNVDEAENQGYTECPTCFEYSRDDYIKKYISEEE